ncbi:MAG: SDR family oxidoreductase [Alphaproteobacteria bacterium]|nr:SDR family oxidoreductase [Alphaproteobacteria bacterium]
MMERVLVTGGSLGIGRAIAERAKRDGYQVTIFDLVPPKDAALGHFVAVDLADEAATASALAAALKHGPITRLINNVGMVRPALLEDTKLGDFDAVIRLNVRVALQCTQALVPGMRAARFGRIVSIGSRAGLGKELRTAYSASKAALVGLTRTWALELAAHGITVNLIAPGPIETELWAKANPSDSPRTKATIAGLPMKRLGKPVDIANAASFFLNAENSFVTGQTLYVCGGASVGVSAI